MSGDWDEKTARVPVPGSPLDPASDATSLGNLLRATYPHLTADIMREASALQKEKPGLRLGEALVLLGRLTDEQVQLAMKAQQVMRRPGSSQTRTNIVLQEMDHATKEVGKLDALIDAFDGLVDKLASKLHK